MPSQQLLLVIGGDNIAASRHLSRLRRLEEACSENRVTVLRQAQLLDSEPTAIDIKSNFDSVIICGNAEESKILSACRLLRSWGLQVIVAIDSLDSPNPNGLSANCLESLEAELCQISLSEAVIYLINGDTKFVYAYPKADVAASVVVLLEQSQRVLLVKRKFEPFQGSLALPGGFLRPLLEDLPTCAARELEEETGVALSPENLHLVSVRSNPNRDRRGHVIDSGYLAFVGADQEQTVLQSLKASDDADEACFFPLSLALKLSIAADHATLLADAVQLARRKRSEVSSVKRFVHEVSRWLTSLHTFDRAPARF